MGRRLLLALSVLTVLTFASVAAGAGAGAKYKLRLNSVVGSCKSSNCDFDSIVVRRLDDDRRSCRPFVMFLDCRWTARAGTKVVLETTADPPFDHHTWGGDCSGTGKCVLVMDSNKTFSVTWTAP